MDAFVQPSYCVNATPATPATVQRVEGLRYAVRHVDTDSTSDLDLDLNCEFAGPIRRPVIVGLGLRVEVWIAVRVGPEC